MQEVPISKFSQANTCKYHVFLINKMALVNRQCFILVRRYHTPTPWGTFWAYRPVSRGAGGVTSGVSPLSD